MGGKEQLNKRGGTDFVSENNPLLDFKKFNFLKTDHFCLLGHSLGMSKLLTVIGKVRESPQGRAVYFFNYRTNSKSLFWD